MPSSLKLKTGKKYGRLQKYKVFTSAQERIFKELENRAEQPYNPPADYNTVMQSLRQPFQQGSAQQTGMNYLQGLMSQDPQAMQAFEAPYKRQFSEEILPQIAQRFSGLGALNSSGFQQALARAGEGLSERLAALHGGLGMQAAGMMPGMSQMNQQNAQGLLGGATFPERMQNQYQQQALGTQGFGYANIPAQQRQPGMGQSIMPGIGQGIGQGIGTAGSLWAMANYLPALAASSEKVKENVRPYNKGLDVVKGLEVKQFDYIKDLGGETGCVGVIAETVPEELTKNIPYNGHPEGVLSVDLYGLIGLLINSVKNLDARVQKMEAA